MYVHVLCLSTLYNASICSRRFLFHSADLPLPTPHYQHLNVDRQTIIILTFVIDYRRIMDYRQRMQEKEMRDRQNMPSRMAHGAWLGATSSLHTPLFTGVRGTGNGKP